MFSTHPRERVSRPLRATLLLATVYEQCGATLSQRFGSKGKRILVILDSKTVDPYEVDRGNMVIWVHMVREGFVSRHSPYSGLSIRPLS